MSGDLLTRRVYCFFPKTAWDNLTAAQARSILSRTNIDVISQAPRVVVENDARLADGTYYVFETNTQLASASTMADHYLLSKDLTRRIMVSHLKPGMDR